MKLYTKRAGGVLLGLTLGLMFLSSNNLLAQGASGLTSDQVQAIIAALQSGQNQLTLPLPEGQSESFSFQAEQIMEVGLANQYPEIRAWRAMSSSGWEIYLDHDATNLHLTALRGGQTWFLTPSGNAFRYQEAGKDSLQHSVSCIADEKEFGLAPFPQADPDDGERPIQQARHHVFRVAVAATGEYTQYHGGSKSLAMAKIVSVINRINAVFRRDVAISFQLVAGNDQLVFTQSYTDPFTSGDLYNLIQENQLLLDQVIGDANYDIGIVFDQAPAGAIAYYNSACQSGFKGQAAVSLTHPDGDAFAIDYVAHEFGHFFGAHHTHNNLCFRYAPTAYEPGSGSTIMGYAGVCYPSYQQNSDAYFHAASIDEIRQTVNSGLLCGQSSTHSNQAPIVIASQPQFAIPKATPFTLSAFATDPDGDSLSFAWEQWDLGHPGPSDPYQAYGPLIRSRIPSSSPKRTIPRLEDLLSGNIAAEEALPQVDRNLRFRLTSRDNHPQASLVGHGYLDLEVSAQAGPFRVLAPSVGTDWPVGSMQWVKWNVANTDQAPVLCDKVDIWLSTDGGYHFDSLLAASVPNIGHVAVLVPNLPGQQARIRVSAANNIFFALSEADFSISAVTSPVYYLFNLNPDPEVCLGDSLLLRMWLGGLGGYQGIFSLRAAYTQNPNLIAQWENSNPIGVDNFIQLRLPTDPNLTGWQSLDITVVDQVGDSLRETYDFYVVADFPERPALNHPEDGSILSQLDRLDWGYCGDASSYRWELAMTPDFDASIIASGITLDTTSLTLPPLQAGQVYYWRVQSRNSCGVGRYSRVASFASP
ncbi:MAG: reprolysin-like metallopeptidase, partial [Bacteroidota bacterium]